jgi:cysteine-rich repeat protein
VWHGPVCASLGLACENGACVGTGGPCNAIGGAPEEGTAAGMSCSADGSALDACVNGRQALLDCSLQGPRFRCQEAGGIAFCGLASECVPELGYLNRFAFKESCDGDTLVFCNKGRIERVDCLSLGFVGCDLDGDFIRFGCVDAQSCGNGIVDPGEQCEDGNHDRLDGCVVCRWSCTEDRHCNSLTGQEECMEFACQSDHTCAPAGPKPDGTGCYMITDTANLSGSCTAGVCTPPTNCGAVQCKDPDGNDCNGKPACMSPPDSSGSCTGAIAPLVPGDRCGTGAPASVCDVNGACVPTRCGNGVVDADLGEDCDPPGGICNSECQHSF